MVLKAGPHPQANQSFSCLSLWLNGSLLGLDSSDDHNAGLYSLNVKLIKYKSRRLQAAPCTT